MQHHDGRSRLAGISPAAVLTILLLALGALGSPLLASRCCAQVVFASNVVTIDASSPQPVGSGIIPPNANGEIIVLAEGGIRGAVLTTRFDQGWAGPAGYTRLDRSGQPVSNGMPYGALMGGFSANPANYRYVGRMGAFDVIPAYVGQEFRLALNVPLADMPVLEGNIEVTVMWVADGYPDLVQVTLEDGTALPAPTGIVAAAGDRFVILPYGSIRTNVLGVFDQAWFGPGGLPRMNRFGQPYAEGPYGALYGVFSGLPGFYLGDNGTLEVGAGVAGRQLFLDLNLDVADLADSDGRFTVSVLRLP